MGERRDFRLLLLSSVITIGSFALLLPVVPLWAEVGGADPTGVGATNAVFLMVTVAAQFGVPKALRLLGHREALAAGAVLVGVPVFAYALTSALPVLLVISALRGVGFALVVVTGSALVPRLLPPRQHGRGVGWYGLAIGLPNAVFLPTGPWLAEHISFPVVFVVGGVLPLLGSLITLAMRIRTRQPAGTERDAPRGRPVRLRDMAAPFVVMCVAALASSAFVTFLPAASDDTVSVTAGLLCYSVGSLIGRWVAGVVADRYRRPALITPGVVVGSLGAFLLVVFPPAGGLLFGLGFGAVQNTTLTAMFRRVDARGYDVASTVWNMAFDGGTGLGSLVLGLVATAGGYGWSFGAAGCLLAATLPFAVFIGRPTMPSRRRRSPS